MEKQIEIKTRWTEKAREVLLGRKIIAVNYLTEKDMENLGWYNAGVVIKLDDGTVFYPSTDDEGNDAGAIHYQKEGDNEWCLPVI